MEAGEQVQTTARNQPMLEMPQFRSDLTFNDSQIASLRDEMGNAFCEVLTDLAKEISLQEETGDPQEIGWQRGANFLVDFVKRRSPEAIIRKYETFDKYGEKRDMVVIAHYLQKEDKSESIIICYVVDPAVREGDIYAVDEVLIINNEGRIKKVSTLAPEKLITVRFNDEVDEKIGVDSKNGVLGIIWLGDENKAVSFLHEAEGHERRDKNLETLQEEKSSETARRELKLCNFRQMSKGKLDELLRQHSEWRNYLDAIVTSETGAWNEAEKARKQWDNEGFPICSEAVFKRERDGALQTYQDTYQPLFDRFQGTARFI